MKVKVYSEIENTIEFNPVEDDLTMKNYLAIYRCIKGMSVNGQVKYPTLSQSCSAYGLYESVELETKPTTKIEYRSKVLYDVENIETGELTRCTNSKQVAEITGVSKNGISTYGKTGYICNGKWKIHKLHEGRVRASKQVEITNLETGESKRFESVKKVAEYFNKTSTTICQYLKKQRIYKNYKLEYIN